LFRPFRLFRLNDDQEMVNPTFTSTQPLDVRLTVASSPTDPSHVPTDTESPV